MRGYVAVIFLLDSDAIRSSRHEISAGAGERPVTCGRDKIHVPAIATPTQSPPLPVRQE